MMPTFHTWCDLGVQICLNPNKRPAAAFSYDFGTPWASAMVILSPKCPNITWDLSLTDYDSDSSDEDDEDIAEKTGIPNDTPIYLIIFDRQRRRSWVQRQTPTGENAVRGVAVNWVPPTSGQMWIAFDWHTNVFSLGMGYEPGLNRRIVQPMKPLGMHENLKYYLGQVMAHTSPKWNDEGHPTFGHWGNEATFSYDPVTISQCFEDSEIDIRLYWLEFQQNINLVHLCLFVFSCLALCAGLLSF